MSFPLMRKYGFWLFCGLLLCCNMALAEAARSLAEGNTVAAIEPVAKDAQASSLPATADQQTHAVSQEALEQAAPAQSAKPAIALAAKPKPVLKAEALPAFYDQSLFHGQNVDASLAKKIEALALLGHQLRLGKSQDMNALMDASEQLSSDLLALLKQQTSIGKAKSIEHQLRFLRSRISINRSHGHQLAIHRDEVKIQVLQLYENLFSYLRRIWAISHAYEQQGSLLSDSQAMLEKLTAMEKTLHFTLSEEQQASKVGQRLNEHRHDFYALLYVYKNMLLSVTHHADMVFLGSWVRYFSLSTWIDMINTYETAKAINLRLNIFNIDVGGIIVFLLLFCIVTMGYPAVFRLSHHYMIKYLDQDEEIRREDKDNKVFIYLELRKPIRALMICFGIDLSTNALFYRTHFFESIDSLVYVIYVLLFSWLFLSFINTVIALKIDKINHHHPSMRKELFNLLVHIIKIFTCLIAMIVVLMHFGISIAAILSTLGIGGFAFALAAKDTLANFFGGLAILIDDVFSLGDWVKVNDAEGTVAAIGLRSTTLRTFDNALITIPNAQISVSDVMNWNKRKVGRRIKMWVQVTYDSDIDAIKAAVEAIRVMLKNHPGIANPKDTTSITKERAFHFYQREDMLGIKHTQFVYLDRFNDYSIDLIVYCFSKSIVWEEWLAVKEDVLYQIADILKQHDVHFAYPTEVHLQQSLPASQA